MTWLPLGGGVSDDLRSGYTFGIGARASTPVTADSPRAVHRILEANARPTVADCCIRRNRQGLPVRQRLLAHRRSFRRRHCRRRPPRRVAESIENAIARIRATDSLFSDLADRMGTPFAFARYIDPVGVLFGRPQLVIGAKAVQEFYASQGGGTSLSWRPVYADVAGSLDLGFTVGEYSITSRGATGAAVQRFGKYLTVWKRQPDGSWKFVVRRRQRHTAPGAPDQARLSPITAIVALLIRARQRE